MRTTVRLLTVLLSAISTENQTDQKITRNSETNMSMTSVIINRLQPLAAGFSSATRSRVPVGLSSVLSGSIQDPLFASSSRPLVARYSSSPALRQEESSSASLPAGKWYSINGFSKFSSR